MGFWSNNLELGIMLWFDDFLSNIHTTVSRFIIIYWCFQSRSVHAYWYTKTKTMGIFVCVEFIICTLILVGIGIHFFVAASAKLEYFFSSNDQNVEHDEWWHCWQVSCYCRNNIDKLLRVWSLRAAPTHDISWKTIINAFLTRQNTVSYINQFLSSEYLY